MLSPTGGSSILPIPIANLIRKPSKRADTRVLIWQRFLNYQISVESEGVVSLSVSPVVEHAPDRSGIIQIAKAVLSQLVKVHENRDEHHSAQG